jgi:hypothetical protein
MNNNWGHSEFEVNEIQNSPTQSKGYARSNVYHLQLINDTAFPVTVGNRLTGQFVLPANTTRTFWGHPLSSFDVELSFDFSPGHTNLDFITILISRHNGRDFREYKRN